MRGRWICLLVAFAVAVAAAYVPSSATAPSGDANGDRVVDVLDLQMVIAQVLQGGMSAAGADANHDGRVDVRDFQLILEQARLAGPQEIPESPATDEPAVLASPSPEHGARTDLRLAAVEVWRRAPGTPPCAGDLSSSRVRTGRVLRYDFSLTPHAPPTGA